MCELIVGHDYNFFHTFTHYEYLLNMNVVVSNVNLLEVMKLSLKADG